jgi:hypothetical protein
MESLATLANSIIALVTPSIAQAIIKKVAVEGAEASISQVKKILHSMQEKVQDKISLPEPTEASKDIQENLNYLEGELIDSLESDSNFLGEMELLISQLEKSNKATQTVVELVKTKGAIEAGKIIQSSSFIAQQTVIKESQADEGIKLGDVTQKMGGDE